jgi:hypothetical protein
LVEWISPTTSRSEMAASQRWICDRRTRSPKTLFSLHSFTPLLVFSRSYSWPLHCKGVKPTSDCILDCHLLLLWDPLQRRRRGLLCCLWDQPVIQSLETLR